MFGLSVAICAMVVAVGLIAPERLSSGAQAMTGFALRSLDWFFLLSCSGWRSAGSAISSWGDRTRTRSSRVATPSAADQPGSGGESGEFAPDPKAV